MKIYKSNSELSFNITVDGKRRRIVFDPHSSGGSQYASGDEKEQELIEKLPHFGSIFWVFDNHTEKQGEEPAKTVLEDVSDITNCADAKLFLKSKGITDGLRSKAQIKEAANSIGINFIDLK